MCHHGNNPGALALGRFQRRRCRKPFVRWTDKFGGVLFCIFHPAGQCPVLLLNGIPILLGGIQLYLCGAQLVRGSFQIGEQRFHVILFFADRFPELFQPPLLSLHLKLCYRQMLFGAAPLASFHIGVTCGAHGVEEIVLEDAVRFFQDRFSFCGQQGIPVLVQRWLGLPLLTTEDGLFHTIVLKRKRQKKRKEKIAAATYLYQADSDGEWGEIQFDFENKTAQIIRLADWDKMISRPFAKYAISYLLNCKNEKLPKETMISFEM